MMLPAYPPPSTMSFVRLPNSLPVIDFNESITSGTYVSALAARAYSSAAAQSSASPSNSASPSSSADNDSAASSISSSSESDSDDGSAASAGATKGGESVIVKSHKKLKSLRPEAQSKSSAKSKGKKPAVQVSSSTKHKATMPVNAVVHAIDSKNPLRKALIKAHERFGHVSPKKLVYFKKKGKIHSSTIPVRGGLNFKVKDCPVCAVMMNKRPKKPSAFLVEEKKQWDLWEKVFSDSSGKTKVRSLP